MKGFFSGWSEKQFFGLRRIIAVAICLSGGSAASGQSYCSSDGTPTGIGINAVAFGSISNTSGAKTVGYTDYTGLSTFVKAESAYTASVRVNTDGNKTAFVRIWIDWNRDFDFDDPGESNDIGSVSNDSNGLLTKSVAVPGTASFGATRMRVSVRQSSYPGPCSNRIQGEVEDYTVYILDRCATALSTDDPTQAGSDSWIGHVYKRSDVVNAAPSDVNAFGSYYGRVSEAETFSRDFGSSCFTLISGSGSNQLSPDYFAVRFRMNSSKAGICVANVSSDNGSRLSVDGTTVYDKWVEGSLIDEKKILFRLSGTASLVLDYYDSNGANTVSFTALEKISNTIDTTEQSYCIYETSPPIAGNDVFADSPISSDSRFTVSYQWQRSSNGISGWTDALDASTSASYTPPVWVAGTWYYRRVLTVKRTNPGMSAETVVSDSNSGVKRVNAGAAIVTQPSSVGQSGCIGTVFEPISVVAKGQGYQWYRNDRASNTGGTSLGSDHGAQTAAYTPQATAIGTTYYYCEVSSGTCGGPNVTSAVSGPIAVSAVSATNPINLVP